MPRYEIHQVRKQILANPGVEDRDLRPALVVLECLNWNTKEKVLSGKPHLLNWLTSIAQSYGLTLPDMRSGVKLMEELKLMTLSLDGKGQIRLAIAEWEEEEDFDL